MLGISVGAAVVCFLAVFVGATIQGTIGIGLGLVAAPVLAVVDTEFVPGTVVIAVIPLSLAVTWADRAHVQWRDAGLAIVGRFPGVVVGALVAASVSDRTLALLVGVAVLLAVAASLTTTRSTRRVPLNDGTLLGAGLASGFTGTTTGIGGPPMALTYQHEDAATMRSTIAAFFLVGAAMSAAALWAAGEIGTRQLELLTLVVPAVLCGIVASRLLQNRLRPHLVRPLVLGVCAASAVVLLVDALT